MPLVSTPSLEGLSKCWIKPGDGAHWFSCSAWSLSVLAHWRQSVAKKTAVTVWVPDYFCNESLGLLRTAGARLVFYPIDANHHPVAERFPTVTDINRPDLFLLVHYFGEPAPSEDALAFCRTNEAWLVEDAAHALVPAAGIGEAGDCVLYSPHKHVAIPDGAILVVRKDGPAGLAARNDLMRELELVAAKIVGRGRRFDGLAAKWMGKRLLQKFGFRSRRGLLPFATDADGISEPAPPAMSGMAKRLLEGELPRLPELAKHREDRARDWAEMIRSVFPYELGEVVPFVRTPYLSCIAASDQETAESLYAKLHSVGVPASTWPDLPPEITHVDGGREVARRFRDTRIYLPVHQNVSSKKIIASGARLRDAMIRHWQVRQVESQAEWVELSSSCVRKSLTQTWEYGSAKAAAEGWRPQRYVITDDNRVPVALFQVLFKGLPVAGGVARVNRGPLMLREEPVAGHRLALGAIAALAREAWCRRWWMLQIAPLLPPEPEVERALAGMGLRRRPEYPMDSALLSLEPTEENLMKGLDGKWRNCLRKGQKLGVKVQFDDSGRNFQAMLEFYQAQQREKGYQGTSDRMIAALSDCTSGSFRFNLFVATGGGDNAGDSPIGMLVTLRFGDVAEYLIGVTNEEGRKNQANSVLLWEAILEAKKAGCRWFDVGGLAKNTPKGIADFKKGLNPTPYALVGEWRKWLF